MSTYDRAHYRIMRWDDRYTDFVERRRWPDWAWFAAAWEWSHVAVCWLWRRHVVVNDQCGRPEHRACVFCSTGTPNEAISR